ncbi:MAG: PGPGW domain-containing protein [Candidatus Methylomirabilales bacterium]
MPGVAVATLKQARRLIVAVVGGTVLLIGLALLVLPGPAVVVIPLGLAILATEFVWARRLLARVKRGVSRVASALGGRPGSAPRP